MIEKKTFKFSQNLMKSLLPTGSTCSIKKDLNLKVGDFVRTNPVYQNFIFKESYGVLIEHELNQRTPFYFFLV